MVPAIISFAAGRGSSCTHNLLEERDVGNWTDSKKAEGKTKHTPPKRTKEGKGN